MEHLAATDVLIVGLHGVGAEAAKNLCLMGLRSVTLYVRPLNRFESCFDSARACSIASLQDVAPVSSIDVGANYFLSMAQLGCPRARACLGGLAVLNPCVTVSVLDELVLTEEVLRRFHVVVFTGTPRSELVRWSDFYMPK